MKIARDCTCRQCRLYGNKRSKRRKADMKAANRRDRHAAKKGKEPVRTSLDLLI